MANRGDNGLSEYEQEVQTNRDANHAKLVALGLERRLGAHQATVATARVAKKPKPPTKFGVAAQGRAVATQTPCTPKVLMLRLDPKTMEVVGGLGPGVEMHVLHDRTHTELEKGMMFAMADIRNKLLPGISHSKFKRLALKEEVKRHVVSVSDPATLKLWATAGVLKAGGAMHANATNMDGLIATLTLSQHLGNEALGPLVAHVQKAAGTQMAAWALGSPLKPLAATGPPSNLELASPAGGKSAWGYALKLESAPLALQKEMHAMREHWSSQDNPDREDVDSLEPDSYNHNKEGSILRFLGWAQSELNLTPTLTLYNNIGVFMQFTKFLDQRAIERGKDGARAMSKHVQASAAVTALKWLYRGKTDFGVGFKDIKIIRSYRLLEAKYMKAKKKNEKKLSKEEVENWLELNKIREVYKDLSEKVLKGPNKKALQCNEAMLNFHQLRQKHLVVGLFTRIPPLRSQVLRSLRVSKEGYYNRMWLCDKRGAYVLWFPFHKGAGNTNIPDITVVLPKDMNTLITTFITESLPHLCNGSMDNQVSPPASHLFNTPRTKVGFEQNNFSQYMKFQVWKQLTGVAMNAHLLRDVVVTDVYDRACTEAVKDSYSIMMGHSRATQQNTYDRRSHESKSRKAMQDMEGQWELDLNNPQDEMFDEVNDVNETTNSRKRKRSCSKEPAPNSEYELREICGAKEQGDGSIAYKCLWEGYPSDDCTWEPPEHFTSPMAQSMCTGYAHAAKANGTWGEGWESPSFSAM
jgi:hypothetical protein